MNCIQQWKPAIQKVRETQLHLMHQTKLHNDAMKQFREVWMRDTPGVIVAMRHQGDKGYNGLCVWKQKKKVHVQVMPLSTDWIDENYGEGFSTRIASMQKQKDAFYRVPEDTIKTSGWFAMETKKICGLKFKPKHPVEVQQSTNDNQKEGTKRTPRKTEAECLSLDPNVNGLFPKRKKL